MSKFEDLGFSKVDIDRERRTGYPEVIYGEGTVVCPSPPTIIKFLAILFETALPTMSQPYDIVPPNKISKSVCGIWNFSSKSYRQSIYISFSKKVT